MSCNVPADIKLLAEWTVAAGGWTASAIATASTMVLAGDRYIGVVT